MGAGKKKPFFNVIPYERQCSIDFKFYVRAQFSRIFLVLISA